MAKEGREGRQDRKAARQAAADRSRRRNAWLRRGIVVVLVLGAAAMAYSFYSNRQLLDAVATTSYPAGLHATGAISYKENPPMGGTHNAIWQNCGVYEVPIHNEHAVHSMEHGAVWITYRPDLPADQIQSLKAIASDDFMLLSPYPGLASPVIVSAWNHQIALSGAADPKLQAFISQYKNNPQTTPEFGASCSGGTSAPASVDSLSRTPIGLPQ